jgi:hypothetical protein
MVLMIMIVEAIIDSAIFLVCLERAAVGYDHVTPEAGPEPAVDRRPSGQIMASYGYGGLMRAELRANDFPPAAETRFWGSRSP